MSNKLPWFTHDHDAHEDGWIRNLVRKEGHVAGWLWWTLIELMHKHGVGDVLRRDIKDIAQAGLTSTSVVIRVLTAMATPFEGQTKVCFKVVGTELHLEIKKLRERQSKLKSKIPSTFRQPSVNLPIEREGEGEGEKNIAQASPAPEPKPTIKQDLPVQLPRPLTPLQRVVGTYKIAKGIDRDDKDWDKANFAIHARAAKKLLDCFVQDEKAAVIYVIGKGEEFDEKGLEWTLATIARHAWDNRGKFKEESDGRKDSEMGANSVLGPPRRGGITQAGEIVKRLSFGPKIHAGDAGEICASPFLAAEDGSDAAGS